MQRYTRYFSNTLFGSTLADEMDEKDPLMILSKSIDWIGLCGSISKFYNPNFGRPSTDLRKLIGISILKNIYNYSDEEVITAYRQNVVFQAFAGAMTFSLDKPFDSSTLCNFRKKIGQEGIEMIFSASIAVHDRECIENEAIIDSTVQEKYTTFPTDTKLRHAVIKQCYAFSEHLEFKFDNDYLDEVQSLIKEINFSKNVRSDTKKAAKEAAQIRIKDIANSLLDQVEAKVHLETRSDPLFIESMNNYRKAVNQQKNDKNKIYSIFEPHIACIAKGKSHKKWEYGNKVSLLIGQKHKLILGVTSFVGSPYDGDTILDTIMMASRCNNGYMPEVITGDLGYRGRSEVLGVKIITPQDFRNSTDDNERMAIAYRLTRRSAIEPVFGHLKSDHGMKRNLLHGTVGDHINAVSAALGFNFRRFLNINGARSIIAGASSLRKPKSKTRKVPFKKPVLAAPNILPLAA